MMRAGLLLALALAGCAANPTERQMTTAQVTWIATDDRDAAAQCAAMTGNGNAAACVVIAPGAGRHCTVISPRPLSLADTTRLYYLGHEVSRCLSSRSF